MWHLGISFKILFHQFFFFFTLFGLAILGLTFECLTELIGNTSDSVGSGFFTRRQLFGRSICAQEQRNKPAQVVVFVSLVFDLCVTWCLPGRTFLSQNSREKNTGALGRNIIIRCIQITSNDFKRSQSLSELLQIIYWYFALISTNIQFFPAVLSNNN